MPLRSAESIGTPRRRAFRAARESGSPPLTQPRPTGLRFRTDRSATERSDVARARRLAGNRCRGAGVSHSRTPRTADACRRGGTGGQVWRTAGDRLLCVRPATVPRSGTGLVDASPRPAHGRPPLRRPHRDDPPHRAGPVWRRVGPAAGAAFRWTRALGAVAAGALTAVSPAMVYYSRYYIPEMLLTVLTLAAIVCGYRYARNGAGAGAMAAGVCIRTAEAPRNTCCARFRSWQLVHGARSSPNPRPPPAARPAGTTTALAETVGNGCRRSSARARP